MNRPRMLFAAIVSAMALGAAAAHGQMIDSGVFKVFRNDRPLGTEKFELLVAQDSLVLRTRQTLTLPGSQGDEPFEKGADVLIGRTDYSVRQYQSTRVFRGRTTVRAVVIADTHYVAYREADGSGEGDSRVLPPGRLFVMDSQIVALFDLLCRSLHDASFDSRPVNLLALGPRDTMLDARAVSLGSETIRWGKRAVVARKLQLVADDQTTFTFWVGSQGQLLRVIEPVGGLRAERDPPAVKRRTQSQAPPPPKPGG